MAISLETKLAILQQSEYEWSLYLQWLSDHRDHDISVQPKKWTVKLRTLRMMSAFLPLHVSLVLLDIPKRLIIGLYVFLAVVKLRYLQARGLTVVAIAGSYGKTSTKYILTHVLSGERNVLMTPENINTPIGIARLILHTLSSTHEIFVAELGEYYPGDIAGLVRFLSPEYKILTPVGFAHLERFGTTQRLHDALFELVRTQPGKGKVLVYGTDYDESKITQVQVTRAGTEFSFQGTAYFIPLYGRHNAVNTLPALTLASQLGIDHSTVVNKLASLPAIPHRLEPTQLERNILLLDNGYNANPASSAETLRVLSALQASQRIVCTPGYVELGPIQQEENEKLGKAIASVADLCVVIRGVNTQALLRGLQAGGMSTTAILTVKNEEEGMRQLAGRIQSGAIILFENSIPELYQRSL